MYYKMHDLRLLDVALRICSLYYVHSTPPGVFLVVAEGAFRCGSGAWSRRPYTSSRCEEVIVPGCSEHVDLVSSFNVSDASVKDFSSTPNLQQNANK